MIGKIHSKTLWALFFLLSLFSKGAFATYYTTENIDRGLAPLIGYCPDDRVCSWASTWSGGGYMLNHVDGTLTIYPYNQIEPSLSATYKYAAGNGEGFKFATTFDMNCQNHIGLINFATVSYGSGSSTAYPNLEATANKNNYSHYCIAASTSRPNAFSIIPKKLSNLQNAPGLFSALSLFLSFFMLFHCFILWLKHQILPFFP